MYIQSIPGSINKRNRMLDDGMDKLIIRIPRKLKVSFKKLCKRNYKNMSDKIRDLIVQAIDEKDKKVTVSGSDNVRT
jgi:metal-responsive CopG/Arc/MetJ family transcriptional regulator